MTVATDEATARGTTRTFRRVAFWAIGGGGTLALLAFLLMPAF